MPGHPPPALLRLLSLAYCLNKAPTNPFQRELILELGEHCHNCPECAPKIILLAGNPHPDPEEIYRTGLLALITPRSGPCPEPERLRRYIEDQLDETEEAEIRRHMVGCRRCAGWGLEWG